LQSPLGTRINYEISKENFTEQIINNLKGVKNFFMSDDIYQVFVGLNFNETSVNRQKNI